MSDQIGRAEKKPSTKKKPLPVTPQKQPHLLPTEIQHSPKLTVTSHDVNMKSPLFLNNSDGISLQKSPGKEEIGNSFPKRPAPLLKGISAFAGTSPRPLISTTSDDIRRGATVPIMFANPVDNCFHSPPKISVRKRTNSDPWFHTYDLDFPVQIFAEATLVRGIPDGVGEVDTISDESSLKSAGKMEVSDVSSKSPGTKRKVLRRNKNINLVSDAISSGDTHSLKKFLRENINSDDISEEDLTLVDIMTEKAKRKFHRGTDKIRKTMHKHSYSLTPNINNNNNNNNSNNSNSNPSSPQPSPTASPRDPEKSTHHHRVIRPKQESKTIPSVNFKEDKSRRMTDASVKFSADDLILKGIDSDNVLVDFTHSDHSIDDSDEESSSKNNNSDETHVISTISNFSKNVTHLFSKKMKLSNSGDSSHHFEIEEGWLTYLSLAPTPLFTEQDKKSLTFSNSSEKSEIDGPPKMELVAGPISVLISIALDNARDDTVVKSFVFSLRQILPPIKLLAHVIRIFNSTRQLQEEEELYIRMRVILFLKKWVRFYIFDFTNEKTMILMNEFIRTLKDSQNKLFTAWCMLLVKEWREAAMDFHRLKNRPEKSIPGAPPSIVSENIKKFKQNPTKSDFQSLSALDFHPTELARQLTLMDHRIFSEIPLVEFVKKKFSKAESSPNLQKLIQKFNLITKWVGTEIATTPNLRRRVKATVHFINVADELRKLQNYNSLTAVISGLSQFSVRRLKQTWKGIPLKSLDLFNELDELSTPMRGFYKIREACAKASPPLILPLAMLCKDLTFIDDGNEDWIDKEKQILNFKKIEMLGKSLTSIREAQQTKYLLTPLPILQQYLTEMFVIQDEDLLITLSKKSEPPTSEL